MLSLPDKILIKFCWGNCLKLFSQDKGDSFHPQQSPAKHRTGPSLLFLPIKPLLTRCQEVATP